MSFQQPILWVHEEALGPRNPALLAWPDTPALFVFDTQWIEEAQISRKRLGFLYESALDLPLTLRQGDVAAEVMAFAQRHNADGVVSTAPVDPRLEHIADAIVRCHISWRHSDHKIALTPNLCPLRKRIVDRSR